MAKYRRYRNYNRRSRARWAPNIQEIETTTIQAPASANFYQSFTLAFNPTQTNTAVSQTYTVKNIEVNFYIDSTAISYYVEDVTAYIMFVPQGMSVYADYNNLHPEYIMAYKYLGSPTYEDGTRGQNYQPVRVKTRLSRKLQSGDSIILLIKGNNTNTANTSFNLHGLVRWWTKAN